MTDTLSKFGRRGHVAEWLLDRRREWYSGIVV